MAFGHPLCGMFALFTVCFSISRLRIDIINVRQHCACTEDDKRNCPVSGLQALYTVRSDCGWMAVERPLDGQLREYFIGAVKTLWNYAPSGMNNIYNTSLTDPTLHQSTFFANNSERIGGTYHKYQFVEYSDDTFVQRRKRRADEEYLGLLGPLIRAEVGDTIRVHFKNMVSHPLSIHAGGAVAYNKSNEGIKYNDGTTGLDKEDDEISPGHTYVYEWTVPEHVGPAERDHPCLTSFYRSAVDPVKDFNSGLFGPLVVCRKGTLNADGRQSNVDREFSLLFAHFDESESWLLDENIQEFAPDADREDEGFIASNQMHAVNGWSYANIPVLDICKGDTVRLHLAGFGAQTDHHAVYFNKVSLKYERRLQDTIALLPGMSVTTHMEPRTTGLWPFACLTVNHHENGQMGRYNVLDCDANDGGSTNNREADYIRTHYIAAVEMEWDYTPVHFDPVRNQSLDDPDSHGYVFVARGDTSIGSRYKKALYREFTDETFTEEKDRPEHWGFLGPPVYIEVGETVRIVFKNMASRHFSIEAHGVDHIVTSESISHSDATQAGVPPEGTEVYLWTLPQWRAPTTIGIPCVPFIYHSTVNYEHDLFSGLVGPVITCKKYILQDGERHNLEKEFFLFFMVSDENRSWYLQENIDRYCLDPSSVDVSDPGFEESNLMHGINGYLYGNLKGLTMEQNDRVEWYLFGMGNEVDLHSVHFHGQTIVYRTEQAHRADVFELFPGLYSSVRMRPDNPGEWLLHCHVNDHILGGMETFFTILSPSERQ